MVPAREETQPPPEIDRAAVAEAEAELDRRQPRARGQTSEPRPAARALGQATGKAALDARGRETRLLVRDPSTRITQASTRGGFLRGERDKIQSSSPPRQLPRPKSIFDPEQGPVARPAPAASIISSCAGTGSPTSTGS